MIWIGIVAVLLIALVAFFLIGTAVPQLAHRRFLEQRERLQKDFFTAASTSGKPRGLSWKALDWVVNGELPGPTLARDRSTGAIVALVPVTIQFEAIAGSEMEGVQAVGNLRNASAVFFYRRGDWHTIGKAVFNLNPDEALTHFKDQFAPLVLRATGTR